MQAPALTTWPWGPALFPRVSVNYPGHLWPGPGHEWGLRGQSGIRMLEPGVCEPSIVLQAANFSLGPGISSNISNNLWWWNILQWGSADDGDPVLGDTGDISAADNLISCRHKTQDPGLNKTLPNTLNLMSRNVLTMDEVAPRQFAGSYEALFLFLKFQ